MKKTSVACIVLSVVILVAGGVFWMSRAKSHSSLLGSSVYAVRNENQGDIVYDVNELMVVKNPKGYSVYVTDGAALIAEAAFDSDGAFASCTNLSPLKAAAFSEHAIRTRREMQRYLGAPHADIGAGQYLPTYISDDGRLVTFQFADENVARCIVKSIVDL